ncbi:MAG: class I SAM-dependent methyltransferase [Anaerolineales bacterium]
MAFDGSARTYDDDFSHHTLAAWLRQRTWARLDTHFRPGMRVLELGCGTGVDALHLAERGVEVIATDTSPAMLREVDAKAHAAGLAIRTQILDMNDPATWRDLGLVDGAYSNFGALNCTRAWGALFAWLGQQIRPGGVFACGVMGPFCLWETAWHALHGDFRTATRRWSGQRIATLADGAQIPVFYPAANSLCRAARPYFVQRRALCGLGVALPPSDVYPVIEKRPRLTGFLVQCEASLAPRFPWRAWGDHYWLEMERI